MLVFGLHIQYIIVTEYLVKGKHFQETFKKWKPNNTFVKMLQANKVAKKVKCEGSPDDTFYAKCLYSKQNEKVFLLWI